MVTDDEHKYTITLPKSYALTVSVARRTGLESDYGIKIVETKRGCLHVTGTARTLESYVSDITWGERGPSSRILDTIRETAT